MIENLKKKIGCFYSRSLHRQYLDAVISRKAPLVSRTVLDVGSKNRRYDHLFPLADPLVAIDRRPGQDNVMAADALQLPFKNHSFDVVLSFEVLEYIPSTDVALSEIARVLKPRGVFIFSVPFLDPVHGDIDYVRHTYRSWERLLAPYFSVQEMIQLGGRFACIWDFYFEKVRNHYGKFAKLIVLPFLYVTKKIVLWLDQREKSWRYPMGYFYVCRSRH